MSKRIIAFLGAYREEHVSPIVQCNISNFILYKPDINSKCEHTSMSECVRAPALSLYYQPPCGCTVCCGSVATGNRSMITQRA